jgi:hydroxypyruvate reductase
MSQVPRARLEALFHATLAGLDPAARVTAALRDRSWSPRSALVVAAGKAALAMAAGATAYLQGRGIGLAGGVVVAPGPGRISYKNAPLAELPPELSVLAGGHPQRSVRAARAVRDAVAGAPPGAEILALISGGASALMALPAPGLDLDDKIAAVSAVYAGGAPIHDLNTVRKHLSAIKGGRLAAIAPVPILTLVSSDVVGDDLATVGSGPTLPDPGTFARAYHIVASTAGWDRLPPAVRTSLEQGVAGQVAETPALPRPGDRALLVAGTGALLDQAAAAAASAGMSARIVLRGVTGDVADVAGRVAAQARRIEAAGPGGPDVLVAGGEPTITLPRPCGTGGRAQHLALLLARDLARAGTGNRPPGVTVLVAGSDGIDGNSEAAGAVIDGRTWDAVRAMGLDPERALAQRDAFSVLHPVGATLVTGPTGVNHADLILIATGA